MPGPVNLSWINTLLRSKASAKPGLSATSGDKLADRVKVERSGENLNFTLGDRAAINARAQPRNRVLKIDRSEVDESQRGKGYGLAMYLKALEQADQMGRTLVSDASTSTDASNIYAALARRGRKVLRAPSYSELGDSPREFRNSNSGPMFAVLDQNDTRGWGDVMNDYYGAPKDQVKRIETHQLPAVSSSQMKRMSASELARLFGVPLAALAGLSATEGDFNAPAA